MSPSPPVKFQSTLPVRGATSAQKQANVNYRISIHAPREGSDIGCVRFESMAIKFQSTLPVRGATTQCPTCPEIKDKFQSTLPVRGATCLDDRGGGLAGISIHAPREGSDTDGRIASRCGLISIHAPREGSDVLHWLKIRFFDRISIHAPREGSDGEKEQEPTEPAISIHAPREGSDHTEWISDKDTLHISIHAPREGSDACTFSVFLKDEISIHAPREGSDWYEGDCMPSNLLFQSTLPVRGATRTTKTLHRGSVNFNPRSP